VGPTGLWQNLFEGVPEGLLGRKTPLASKDGLVVPVADFGLRAGITDAMNGGEQEIVSRTGSGTRRRPQGFEQQPHAGLFGGQPQAPGRPKSRKVAERGMGADFCWTSSASFSAVPR
jgi:hypothetical protein